ncbi:MAG: transglutaminase domain-containing protein [Phycisphaerales bacterium]|nr:MAG: transglutaminase domain-containing protein [Phycisphaerales bacterium]
MKPHKLIAVVMILTSSAVTGWTCVDIAFPAILGMLGLLGLQRRLTWDIKPERRVITSLLMLVLAMLFSLHYRYGGPPGWNAHEEVMSLAWQTVTRYFLAAMILMLFLGSPQRLPTSLGLFHVANVVCAGQILLLNDRFITFRLLELWAVILLVSYAATAHVTLPIRLSPRGRRAGHWLLCSLVLVAAANAGWIVSSVLYRHVELLDRIPMWFAKQGIAFHQAGTTISQVAFSSTGELSSIHELIQDQDGSVVLTIKAAEVPGYLRGRAFDTYDRSEWRSSADRETIAGVQSMRPIRNNNHVFRFDTLGASEVKSMTITQEAEFDGDVTFAPLGTSALKVLPPLLQRDEHDIFYVHHRGRRSRHRLDYSTAPYRTAPPAGLHARMLEVPSYLDPQRNARLATLTRRIFAGAETTSEKIEAVVNHFRTNYTYSLRFEVPSDREPLSHFLFDASTGYCEYFASGAAILLRLAGVPTRYVTGFLVTVKEPQGRLWVARNMDAHAWVEAWDQEQGQWSMVEATVQETRTGSGAIEQLGRLGGNVSVAFSRFLQAVYDYGLVGVAGWLFTSYGVVTSSVLLATLLATATWWWRFRRGRKTGGVRRRKTRPDPSVVVLHKMLGQMDRKLKASGLRRQLTETLHAFARRLRACDAGDGAWVQVSDWYLEYAELRYCKKIGAEHLEQLHRSAERLRRSL